MVNNNERMVNDNESVVNKQHFKGINMKNNQPIGAYATIQWIEDNPSEISGVYFSFGQYEESTETDTNGVSDATIFYYADGIEDMERLKNSTLDFKVISYELEY